MRTTLPGERFVTVWFGLLLVFFFCVRSCDAQQPPPAGAVQGQGYQIVPTVSGHEQIPNTTLHTVWLRVDLQTVFANETVRLRAKILNPATGSYENTASDETPNITTNLAGTAANVPIEINNVTAHDWGIWTGFGFGFGVRLELVKNGVVLKTVDTLVLNSGEVPW